MTENTGCKTMVDKNEKRYTGDLTAIVELEIENVNLPGVKESDVASLLEDSTGPSISVAEVEFDE